MTPDIANLIIEDVFEGVFLKDSLVKQGVSASSFHRFLHDNIEFGRLYTRAQEAQAEFLAEEIVPIADNELIDPNRARNMISVRQWRASKLRPGKFGEKLEVQVKAEASITAALDAATARSSAIGRPENIVEAEVIETPTLIEDKPTGSKPVDPAESKDDIFD